MAGRTFTDDSAQRIARTVRRDEARQSPLPRSFRGHRDGGGDRILLCKTKEPVTAPAFGTCEIWDGEPGEEVASGEEIEVYFRLGDIDNDVFLFVAETIRAYYAIAKICP